MNGREVECCGLIMGETVGDVECMDGGFFGWGWKGLVDVTVNVNLDM